MVKSSLLAVVLAGFCGAAFADDPAPAPALGGGQVHFVGAVVDAPCNIDPGSVDQTIQMGVLSQTSLYANTTRKQGFDIKLTECTDAAKRAVVTFQGAPDQNITDDLYSGLDNVGIKFSQNETAIKLGQPTAPQTLIDGTNVLHFFAQAVYTGGDKDKNVAQIGDFATASQFNIAYQ